MKYLKYLYGLIAAIILTTIVPMTTYAADPVSVPADIQSYCEEAGAQYNICPELLEAIAWKESRFTPTARNRSCVGLMQIKAGCHKDRMAKLGVTDLTDARSSIFVAADYLSELTATYESPEVVLALYNGDSNALTPGYVSNYASSILQVSQDLERAHGK